MIENNEILKIYGTDYESMTRTLLEEANLVSLIKANAKAKTISDCDIRVGIKPNLVAPTPAFLGATTHPEIISATISYLRDNGINNIVVMEGSWVGDSTKDSFDVCGYNELSERMNVELLDLQKEKSHEEEIEGQKLLLTDAVRSIDFLINVPVLKGHCQTKLTCALKNLKGLLPNTEKRHFHKMGLHRPICLLNRLVTQDFIIVDHICGDLDFEDGGNPITTNCIMVSKDAGAVDLHAAYLLGYNKKDIEYLDAFCEDMTIDDVKVWKLDGKNKIKDDEKVYDSHKKMVDIKDIVNEVDSCSACYGTLIPALDELREEGFLDSLHETICIGQGYRGKSGLLGIGSCTKEFQFNIPGCPPTKEAIKEGLKKYLSEKESNLK